MSETPPVALTADEQLALLAIEAETSGSSPLNNSTSSSGTDSANGSGTSTTDTGNSSGITVETVTDAVITGQNHVLSDNPRTKEEREEYLFTFFTCKVCYCRFDFAMHWQTVLGNCRHSVCVMCLMDLFLRRMDCPFCRQQIAPSKIWFIQPAFVWPTNRPECRELYETQRNYAIRSMRGARVIAEEVQPERD